MISISVFIFHKSRRTVYSIRVSRLSQTLSSKLRIPVDARVLNFGPSILSLPCNPRKLIIERDEEVSAKFAERTIQRYLDLKPLVYKGIKEAFGG